MSGSIGFDVLLSILAKPLNFFESQDSCPTPLRSKLRAIDSGASTSERISADSKGFRVGFGEVSRPRIDGRV
jgi:hypothetical protein